MALKGSRIFIWQVSIFILLDCFCAWGDAVITAPWCRDEDMTDVSLSGDSCYFDKGAIYMRKAFGLKQWKRVWIVDWTGLDCVYDVSLQTHRSFFWLLCQKWQIDTKLDATKQETVPSKDQERGLTNNTIKAKLLPASKQIQRHWIHVPGFGFSPIKYL